MKAIITILLLTPFFLIAQSTKNAINIKEVIVEFGKAFMAENEELPSKFVMPMEGYKNLLQITEPEIKETEIPKQYEKYLKKTYLKYNGLKKECGHVLEILSFDTITFIEEKMPVLDLSLLLKVEREDYFNKGTKIDTIRTVFDFVAINNQLKIIPSMREISDLHYNLLQLDLLKRSQKNNFYDKYDNYYFNTSVYNAIPIRKNNKWGLVSLKNETLLPAIYDSIFPFQFDYYRVTINGWYNLVDKNFKLVFKENKKYIKLVNDKYISDGNGVVNKPVFEEDYKTETIIIEAIDEISSETYTKVNAKTPEKELTDKLYEQYYKNTIYKIENKYTQNPRMPSHYVIHKETGDTLSTHFGYSFIDPHGDYLLGNKNDTTFIMDQNGKVLFKNHYVCSFEAPGYVDIFNKTSRLFGMYCPYTNVYIKPQYKFIKAIDRDRFFVVITQAGKFGYLDSDGRELFD